MRPADPLAATPTSGRHRSGRQTTGGEGARRAGGFPTLTRRTLILAGGAVLAGCDSQEATMPADKAKPGPTEHLTSRDGTTIAYERWGSGPPVILVDGAFCSRRFGPTDKLAPLLARRFTVFAYDRRGRGGSDDGAPGSMASEIEDLAALVARAGRSARVFGMSSGGALALEAAAHGVPMEKLAVYEVPYLVNPPPGGRPPTMASGFGGCLRRAIEAAR